MPLILLSRATPGASIALPELGRDQENVNLVEFPADWKSEGCHAALIRNERMLDEGKPDLVIAFPSGGGTWHTCSLAEKLGIPVVKLAPGQTARA